ncbi:hypothetical protein BROUX41_000826 [Berkeleyomyces rouxiae]|uniref:uncharacterized protein n=1 Tax=Berkeleyomyces rouxiae TaxID=2035830 RepID=UPI003B76A8BA
MASYALYSGQALAVPLALEDLYCHHSDSDLDNSDCEFQSHDSYNHPEKSQKSQTTEPFQKWIKTLQRRAQKRPKPIAEAANVPWQLMDHVDRSTLAHARGRRLSTCSSTSSAYVCAVKTASISMASTRRSISRSRSRSQSQSRRLDTFHHTVQADRASRASHMGNRLSTSDGDRPFSVSNSSIPPLSSAALSRASQRRRLVEELVKTEEGYISDVRFLMNVYITIFAGLPTLPDGLRASINHNLTAIVELHEEIIRELYRVVPHLEYSPSTYNNSTNTQELSGKQSDSAMRMRLGPSGTTNADGKTTSNLSHPYENPEMFAETQVTEDVAKIFTRKMGRFFIYKEYGANYEIMMKDVTAAHRMMPDWDTYQKGLETLASSICPSINHDDASRKALTIGDLLVKPIQRICRYPLIFTELLKLTPGEDCPNSHMAVEEALIRVREATTEINKATTDARMKTTLERTWMLQDRLVFSNQRLDAVSKNRIRSFGHIKLCGTLHVCWQTKEGADGQYMICLLYNDVICLASASKADQIYSIQACIDLANLRLEEVDNGKGIQCHTAPFSWKLVFEHNHQLYELILTACSPKEELEWKSRLKSCMDASPEWKDVPDHGDRSFLDIDIKSLGTIFGMPGTATHRISIHRASTIGSKSQMCQVILKNTCVLKEAKSTNGTSINRSHSLLASNNRIAVLAPTRAERARLEAMLSDIWSKEVLPFPGMTTRARSEHVVRSTTSSMIRRLSVASITSTFTRRTNSLASISKYSTAGMSPGSVTGVMTPGTPPSYFDEPSPSIQGMMRKSTDTSSGYFPPEDQDLRPMSQLPVIEDESGRKPLRRMTLPTSSTKFTIRDIWAAGEANTNGTLMETEAIDEKSGTEDDVLEMRGSRSSKTKAASSTDVHLEECRSTEPQDVPICYEAQAIGATSNVEDKPKVLTTANMEESSASALEEVPNSNSTELEDGQVVESPSRGKTRRRVSKRWSSSSGRHRESVAHSIRSLFR